MSDYRTALDWMSIDDREKLHGPAAFALLRRALPLLADLAGSHAEAAALCDEIKALDRPRQ